ncbi:MAG: F0F1 ATP synthase subunit delta [Lachnospiraceae bacterium]|nr:F0F1 ATP synthase subunit delta [Lachnospiraceae bacterium]
MAKQVDTTYGNALFELALEENKIDDLFTEVKALTDILKGNDELIKLLAHPQVNKDEKKKIVEDIFSGKLSDDVLGLLVTVVDKGHILNIVDILEYFIKLVKKHKNIGEAKVTSAVTLTDEQKNNIKKRLIETTAYDEIETEYIVDKSLIGGLVIRIEDRVVDSSIRTKLDKMSKTLANA